jgi:hypothetical protein
VAKLSHLISNFYKMPEKNVLNVVKDLFVKMADGTVSRDIVAAFAVTAIRVKEG